MSIAKVFKLCPNITCHAWNKDKTEVAICPNSNEIWIYSNCTDPDVRNWRRDHILKEHDLLVSALDWSPVHGQIVSCSHDRNAFVWTRKEDGDWEPTLVILRINRAALDVKWSPNGKKFAVASGAKVVPVCYYEEENKWWISKIIRRPKSTVMGVAWHPNSQLLASAGADYKCRIASAYIPQVDETRDPGPFAEGFDFGLQVFALEAQLGHWIEACAWSPCGTKLAYVSHGSMVTVVHFAGAEVTQQPILLPSLPLTTLKFLSADTLLAGGYDRNVAVFRCREHENGAVLWEFARFFEREADQAKPQAASSGAHSFRDRMRMFENKASKGTSGGAGGSGGSASASKVKKINTTHDNSISCMTVEAATPLSQSFVSTSGVDGKLVVWKLGSIPGLELA